MWLSERSERKEEKKNLLGSKGLPICANAFYQLVVNSGGQAWPRPYPLLINANTSYSKIYLPDKWKITEQQRMFHQKQTSRSAGLCNEQKSPEGLHLSSLLLVNFQIKVRQPLVTFSR